MKKLFSVVVLTLAINFLAVAGGVVWLHQTKRLDREKALAIREILFPKPAEADPATTQPADAPTTQPIMRLDELLAKSTGRSATEQVQFLQTTFDAQMVQLERRHRELNDLQRQIELAKEQLSRDRGALDKQQAQLTLQQQETERLASDKGFQDSLKLYNSMPSKQVKSIFMTLDDQTVMSYLQTMQPRTAARIVKEFKTPEEITRIQQIMEKMRSASAGQQASAQAKE